MSDTGSQNEQSMDEILASIRKIISDEPEPAGNHPPSPAASANQDVPGSDAMLEGGDYLSDILEPISDAVSGRGPRLGENAQNVDDRRAQFAGSMGAIDHGAGNVSTPLSAPGELPVETQSNAVASDSNWPFDDGDQNAMRAARVEPGGGAALARSDAVGLQDKLASLGGTRAARELPQKSEPAESARRTSPSRGLGPSVSINEDVRSGIGASVSAEPSGSALGSQTRPMPNEIKQAPIAEPAPVSSRLPMAPIDTPAQPDVTNQSDAIATDADSHPRPAGNQGPADAKSPKVTESPATGGARISQRASSPAAKAVAVAAPTIAEGIAPAMAARVEDQCADVRDGLGKRTLEDLVVDVVRPMLQEWIDANMPKIARQVARAELRRREGSDGADN